MPNDRPAASMRHNLPVSMTPFVGREAEMALLLERLHDPACRMLTITGAGGIGKTRLALEVTSQIVSDAGDSAGFPHGVFFVSLANITAFNEAPAIAVANALDLVLSGPDSATLQVRNYLREKALLLVFDNVDQLIDEAYCLSELLQQAPALKLLLTSRERMRLRGEWVIELDGLTYPSQELETDPFAPEDYSAIQLFLLQARMHAPAMALTVESVLAIARICRLVGGIPLGIELAASWTRVLSCPEIADEIAKSIGFLTGGTIDMPDRQQSMRAVFAASWNLLSTEAQQALRQMAVFPGSFTREAAAAVADAPLPLLVTLIDKSLVRRVGGGNTTPTRYMLLEPLRQFATDALTLAGKDRTIAQQHADYYLNLLHDRTADLHGPKQPAALAALSLEIGQLRAAWRSAISQRDGVGIERAMNGLFHLYDMRSWFSEGAEAFGAAREAFAEPTDATGQRLWGRLLAREGWFVFHAGRQREAQAMLQQSLEILRADGTSADLVWSLNYLAAVDSYLGEYATTETLCHESLTLTDANGDTYGRVIALSVLCQTAYERGNFASARVWGEQSLGLEQQIGSPWSIAFSLTNLGKVVAALGDHNAARDLFERSLRIRQGLSDSRGIAICLNRLGDVALALGDPAEAVERYIEALGLFREIGNRWGIAAALLNIGRLALTHAPDGASVRLLHESLELALDTGSVPQIAAIVTTFAHALRRSGQPSWATELDRLAAIEHTYLDQYQIHAARLLAWSAAAAPSAVGLEQAIAATRAATHTPVADQHTTHAPTFPEGLTAREVEVLRLVAQGLTDAQVADQLVLSRRTVHAHLSSIYSKLQVNTRSAATRFAVDHGLA